MHLMVAAYLGIKPKEATPEPNQEDMAALMETFPVAPKPVVMSPEEYLRRKAENHGE